MNRINFLPPWVETNLQPAFYDLESGTSLQQTARMYNKVNELVRSVNTQNETIADYIQQFIDLREFCEDYFENLDVQTEINNKLDEMVADGTLLELLTAKDFADNYELFFRTSFVKSKIVDNMSNMNGGCVLPDNSIIQFTGVNGEVYHFAQDGTVLNSNTIANIGHCNSCTYNTKNEKIYVTVTGSSTIGYYKIFEIDPLTLTLTDTIDCEDKDFPAPQLGIVYDAESDGYIFANWWNGSPKIWKTDSEFNVIAQEELPFTGVKSTSNLGNFGEYVAVNNMGTHQMFLFSKSDLSYYKTLTLNELISNTWVITEEQWWDTRTDGKIVLGCHAGASANPHRGHVTYIYAIFDPTQNYAEYPYGDNYPPREEFYRVDHTYTGNDRNGTAEAPFNNVYEALNASLRTNGTTGSVTIRFSNGSATMFDPIFTMNKSYKIWYPNGTINFFSSIAVASGCKVHINRPVTLTLLDSKTDPFGEGTADIHCYGTLTIGGELKTSDNTTPTIRGYNDSLFEGNFPTCGVDVENYYGSINYFGNENYGVADIIKNLHFAYNNKSFPNQYKGVRGSVALNDSNKYVVPALSKVIAVVIKVTFVTTGNVSTAYECPILWSPNLWVNDVITDLDGTNHTLSINTDGTVAVTNNSNATINRVRIISM